MRKVLVLAVLALATAAFAQQTMVIDEDSSGLDRFFTGGWAGGGNFIGFRDNILINGDTWIGTNGQFIVHEPYGASDGVLGDPGIAGVYGGATGDTKIINYNVAANTVATSNPLILIYDAKAVVHRIATDRSGRYNARIQVNSVTQDFGDIVGASETEVKSRYFVTHDVYLQADANGDGAEVIDMNPTGTQAESGFCYDGPVDEGVGLGYAVGYDATTGTYTQLAVGDAIAIRMRIVENDGFDPGYLTAGEADAKNVGIGSNLKLVEAVNGDTNFDQTVDLNDASNMLSGFGTAAGAKWHEGDFDQNGTVDLNDASAMLSNFGSSFDAAPVPEPATLSLLALGGLALIRRRR